MKLLKILAVFYLSLSLSKNAKSQAIVNAGTIFHYAYLSSYFDFTQQFYSSFTFDTITISGKKYSNITSSSLGFGLSNYIIRLDSGKLYWYRDSQEYLIFNYNAILNDSINVYCNYYYHSGPNQLDTLILAKVKIDTIGFDTLIINDTIKTSVKWFGYSTKLHDKKTNTLRIYKSTIYEKFISLSQSYSNSFIGQNWLVVLLSDDHTYLRCIEKPLSPIEETMWWYKYSKKHNCNFSGWIQGLNEIQSNYHLTIYPNPATNELHIETTRNEKLTAQLFDITGKQVMESTLFTNNTTINTSSLSEGLYFVRITNANGTVVKTGKVGVVK